MMGGALARGLVRAQAMPPSGIRLYDTHTARAEHLAGGSGHGCRRGFLSARRRSRAPTSSCWRSSRRLSRLARSDLPPPHARPSRSFPSPPASGSPRWKRLLPADIPVIRTMPNTPCLVGAGATALCRGTHATRRAFAARPEFVCVGRRVGRSGRAADGCRDGPFRVRPGLCLSDDRGARRTAG